MRVAVDATPLLGAPTGVAQSLRGLLAGLALAAPDVEVVPYVLSGRAARRGPVVVGGRPALALPLPAGLAIRVWGRLDRPVADRWLPGADVVHGSNFVVPPMRSVPGTATVHDCWCARHPERCAPEVAALTATVRRAVARGAWLHVTTEHGAAEVAEVYGAVERVAVVPFGVPTTVVEGPAVGGLRPADATEVGDGVGDAGGADGDRPVPVALGGRPYVLALGALDPRKGLAGLVRAFAPVAATDADVSLVLAGPDGAARAEVEAAMAALPPGARSRVHLLGAVDDPTRRALLGGATVLAYPSLDEGFGFPVLEAMAAGVAVVASDAGALPEVTGGAATLVPVADDDALAAALLAVLGDDAGRAAVIAGGLARAATFTWERTARGMADLWQRAAGA
jgi:glycosyltransferase involved in cell wall biosynthesis